MITPVDVFDRVFRTLASFPSDEEVMDLYTTDAEDKRLLELAEISKQRTFTQDEEFEFWCFRKAEEYARYAKAQAILRSNGRVLDK